MFRLLGIYNFDSLLRRPSTQYSEDWGPKSGYNRELLKVLMFLYSYPHSELKASPIVLISKARFAFAITFRAGKSFFWKQTPVLKSESDCGLFPKKSTFLAKRWWQRLKSSLLYLLCGEDQLNDDVTHWLLPLTEYRVGTYSYSP